MRWSYRLQQIMKGQRQGGFWARWLSEDGELQFPSSRVGFDLFSFQSRSWNQSGVFFFSLFSTFLWCVGTQLCPAVQKLIIEGVRGGRCLPHFTVPTCFMNEQPPGSRDWATSSARTSQPLAFFQSKCVHSAHFSADRGLMQLGGVPGNAEWAGVIIPRGLLTLMFGSRAGIFCFFLPFTVEKGKKGS